MINEKRIHSGENPAKARYKPPPLLLQRRKSRSQYGQDSRRLVQENVFCHRPTVELASAAMPCRTHDGNRTATVATSRWDRGQAHRPRHQSSVTERSWLVAQSRSQDPNDGGQDRTLDGPKGDPVRFSKQNGYTKYPSKVHRGDWTTREAVETDLFASAP